MSGNRGTVLLTGGSGFVGQHVAPALAAAGWKVRRALRRPQAGQDDIPIDAIGPHTDWRQALAGVDAVVHLAARVHHPNEEHATELYRNVNVDGTLQLARSAAAAGIRRFIFVSTILVNGRSTDGRGPFDESDVLTPRGIYGHSKAAAEAGLKAVSEAGRLGVTVIRPPLVYGAGAKGNFRLLVLAARYGIPLPFASIRNRRAFLSIENLVSFMVDRLERADAPFEVFVVADNEQVSTPEFCRRLAEAAGRKPRLFPLPVSILSPLLRLSGRVEAHDSVIGSLELDTSRAAATGWRPLLTIEEGLRRAMTDAG